MLCSTGCATQILGMTCLWRTIYGGHRRWAGDSLWARLAGSWGHFAPSEPFDKPHGSVIGVPEPPDKQDGSAVGVQEIANTPEDSVIDVPNSQGPAARCHRDGSEQKRMTISDHLPGSSGLLDTCSMKLHATEKTVPHPENGELDEKRHHDAECDSSQ